MRNVLKKLYEKHKKAGYIEGNWDYFKSFIFDVKKDGKAIEEVTKDVVDEFKKAIYELKTEKRGLDKYLEEMIFYI